MAYNRRSGGGGGYGGYGGGGGGGRYNNGGYRGSGASGSVNPWQSNSGNGGLMGRQSQQGGPPPPAQLAMASNIITKLLTSTNSMVMICIIKFSFNVLPYILDEPDFESGLVSWLPVD